MMYFEATRAYGRGTFVFGFEPTFNPEAPNPVNEARDRAERLGYLDRDDRWKGYLKRVFEPTGPVIPL